MAADLKTRPAAGNQFSSDQAQLRQIAADVLKYAVAIGGALGLAAAAGFAMLGVSRTGYSLATNLDRLIELYQALAPGRPQLPGRAFVKR